MIAFGGLTGARGVLKGRRLSASLSAVLGLCLALVGSGALAQPGPMPPSKDWFPQYDKNRDGKMDREEFQQLVVEAFFFRDADKDGYVALIELRGASPEAVKAASRRGEQRLSLAEYINALFRDFEAADTDRDGMLTIDEIEIYVRTNRR